MSRSPKLQAEVEALLEQLRTGTAPTVPAHVPEPAGATAPGLTYCMRCGRLLESDAHGEAVGASKPCQVVKVGLRAWPPTRWIDGA
jgi:hypothetical protein